MIAGLSFGLGSLLLTAELVVGVAPFRVLGLPGEQGAALRLSTQEALEGQRRGRQVARLEAIDAAVLTLELDEEALGRCLEDGPCAARLARLARVDELLVGQAAGLGHSYMLRLTLVDARRGVVSEEVQQTVEGELAELTAALADQVDRLVPPRRPWYRRWWLWTVVGVTLAAAVVVTAVVLSMPDEPQLDTYPLP